MKKLIMGFILLSYSLVSMPLFSADNPGDYFKEFSNGSSVKVDHSIFGSLLSKYLDDNHPSGINRFDYNGVTSADMKQMEKYLDYMSGIQVSSLNRNEQMAFWINLYNAVTVKVILDNYPLKSIRDISSGLFSRGPWKLKLITVEGYDLTLNQIEHEILRPIWKDKRVHYAVNCASLGCPNLQPVPFTGSNLNKVLEKGTEEYINHSRAVRIDGNTLRLSSIYKWYDEDFGTKQGLLDHLAEYSSGSKRESLRSWKGSIKYDYDWNLNEH